MRMSFATFVQKFDLNRRGAQFKKQKNDSNDFRNSLHTASIFIYLLDIAFRIVDLPSELFIYTWHI